MEKKMVFIGGPRQVGKTTLAKTLALRQDPQAAYLNWDDPEDRRDIRAMRFPAQARVLVLDEVHKFSGWRNHLKGLFDKHRERYRILVTGSARLDYYRRGGDSLLGRYYHYRLHPFSVRELLSHVFSNVQNTSPFDALRFPDRTQEMTQIVGLLTRFGGFPESFLAQDATHLRRWHLERRERLLGDDIRDTEMLRDLNKMEMLMDLIPSKVGSLFSLNSLREDMEVTHATLSHWMDILERFYVHFRIRPFSGKTVRSLRKEPKLYLWDWSEAPEGPARLENLAASHLLKFVHWLRDAKGHKADLCFLRDTDQREVDFLVTVDHRPWFAVEVKTSVGRSSNHLRYFAQRLKIPYLYQVAGEDIPAVFENGVHTMGIAHFLAALI